MSSAHMITGRQGISSRRASDSITCSKSFRRSFDAYKDRDIILLGHSFNFDLDVRAKFGFRPEDYRITGTLDTCEISNDVLNRDFKSTPKNVLKSSASLEDIFTTEQMMLISL